MNKFFAKKYIWVPVLLFIYGAIMASVFGPDLVNTGHKWNLIAFIIADSVIIFLAFIFLRKRYRIDNP